MQTLRELDPDGRSNVVCSERDTEDTLRGGKRRRYMMFCGLCDSYVYVPTSTCYRHKEAAT